MSGTAPRPRVVLVDGVPMSGLISEAQDPRAVVVAFHGGASTAAYFDCPGHPRLSLLRIGVALGYTVVALDRPGYGASAPYPEAMRTPRTTRRAGLRRGRKDSRSQSARCRFVSAWPLRRLRAGGADGRRRTGRARDTHRPRIGRYRTAVRRRSSRDPKDRDLHSATSRAARVALAARAPLSGRRAVRNDELRDGCTVRGGDGQRLAATRFSGARRRSRVCRCSSASPSTSACGGRTRNRWPRSPRCSRHRRVS